MDVIASAILRGEVFNFASVTGVRVSSSPLVVVSPSPSPPSLDVSRAAFFVLLVALGTSRWSNDDDDDDENNSHNNTAKKTTTRKKTSSSLRIIFALSELLNASSFITWICFVGKSVIFKRSKHIKK